MDAMEQLYQQVILDHAKAPHGRGLPADAAGSTAVATAEHDWCSGQSHQVNTTCGDEVTLRVDVDLTGARPVVSDVRWEGSGCSISQASISVLHDLVTGVDLDTVTKVSTTFRALLGTRGAGLGDEAAEDLLGDANAFTGVGKFPARIKCALLGWAALTDALILAGVPGSTAEATR
jgi:nitrogen fixation NifU-like protein